MIETGLELLDYRNDGMLSDGDLSVIEKIYGHILDNPKQLLNYGFCTSGGGSHSDCVIKLGKDICDASGDGDICDMVSKAAVLNETAETLLQNDLLPDIPNVPTIPQVDISTKLNSLLDDFKDVDCSQMSDEIKQELVNRLNNLETQFVEQGRQAEFKDIISKLSCDVVSEFKCNEIENKFEAQPQCNKKLLRSWSKPIAIGGMTGVGVGLVFHKVLKGPATISVLAGTMACAGMTYYIKHQRML